MNEEQIIDAGQQRSDLYLTSFAQQGLKNAANWGFGLSILGFIGIGFMVIGGIAMLAMSSLFSKEMTGGVNFPFWTISLLYLVLAGFYFFPVYYLFQFSSRMKRALQGNDVESLTESCINLGKHYKCLGIMVIALIGLYIILIFVMMGFGMFMANTLAR